MRSALGEARSHSQRMQSDDFLELLLFSVSPCLRGGCDSCDQMKKSSRSPHIFPNLLAKRINGREFDFRTVPVLKKDFYCRLCRDLQRMEVQQMGFDGK